MKPNSVAEIFMVPFVSGVEVKLKLVAGVNGIIFKVFVAGTETELLIILRLLPLIVTSPPLTNVLTTAEEFKATAMLEEEPPSVHVMLMFPPPEVIVDTVEPVEPVT